MSNHPTGSAVPDPSGLWPDDISDSLSRLYADRPLAHRVLFKHKHKTPEAGAELIGLMHRPPTPYLLVEGFRGLGKSTTAEEAIAVQAGFEEFHNCLIVGAKEPLAAERLSAIKAHLEGELFIEAFGDLRGPVWADTEIQLSTRARIKVVGRGMSLLGIKHLDWRPDLVLIDDFVKAEERLSLDQMKTALDWLLTTLLPALDPEARVMLLGTQRDKNDVIGLIKSEIEQATAEAEEPMWTAVRYPIEYLNDAGQRAPTWADRFPLPYIDRLRSSYRRQGKLREFNVEYMCAVENEGSRLFKGHMLKVEPQVRTWQAIYTMHDPARSIKTTSATTGFAAWSYIGPRIIVWDAWARMLMPDQIVDSLFDENRNHQPVYMGFEEDGLNEWALQPIRREQLRRHTVLPLKRMKAPKGKIDFIGGLAAYANAGELIFAKELPELRAQLLNFPGGKIDAPNALAYLQRMRPGGPMYEDFSGENVIEELISIERPVYMVLNAGGGVVTGVMVQFYDGLLRVLADWVREGEPSEVLTDIVREASVEVRRTLRYVAPPVHFDRFNNMGLVQAANRLPIQVETGTDAAAGRPVLRDLLKSRSRGFADVLIASQARTTVNAFAGGYCRGVSKNGTLAELADEGHYKVLMEGLESFAGLMALGIGAATERNYRVLPNGQRYVSTMPGALR